MLDMWPQRNSNGAVTALPLFVHRQAKIGTVYRAGHWWDWRRANQRIHVLFRFET